MKSIKLFFLQFILVIAIQGCHTYIIDKESAARQMTNLKIGKRNGIDFDFSNGKNYGNTHYSNNLKYLIIKNESSQIDSIFPFDIKFFLKSGVNTGYLDPSKIIFKEGYFISFNDTTLKTNPKCKLCRIHIDSVEKIVIKGVH